MQMCVCVCVFVEWIYHCDHKWAFAIRRRAISDQKAAYDIVLQIFIIILSHCVVLFEARHGIAKYDLLQSKHTIHFRMVTKNGDEFQKNIYFFSLISRGNICEQQNSMLLWQN